MDNIYSFVKNKTGINKQILQNRVRKPTIVFARSLFSCIAVTKAGYSISAVARELKRDHTTILNQLRLAENNISIKQISDDFVASESIEDRVAKQLKSRTFPKLYNELYDIYDGSCAVCKFNSVVEICHIKPRYLGGEDSKENLIVLCPNHHAMFDKGLLKIKDIHKES